MKNKNTLGIWINQSYVFLTDLANEQKVPTDNLSDSLIVSSEMKLELKNKLIFMNMDKDQSEYYQKISSIIRNYNKVIIFGTTDAKKELITVLDHNCIFKDIKVELRETQCMTKSQLSAFCKS